MFSTRDSRRFYLNQFHYRLQNSSAMRLCFYWSSDGLDFVLRGNESVLLKDSVLFADTLGDLLCGLNAESLWKTTE